MDPYNYRSSTHRRRVAGGYYRSSQRYQRRYHYSTSSSSTRSHSPAPRHFSSPRRQRISRACSQSASSRSLSPLPSPRTQRRNALLREQALTYPISSSESSRRDSSPFRTHDYRHVSRTRTQSASSSSLSPTRGFSSSGSDYQRRPRHNLPRYRWAGHWLTEGNLRRHDSSSAASRSERGYSTSMSSSFWS